MSIVQRSLRAGFLQVEGLFNRAFGDKLNPFYHLGAISFFLFWVVSVTGIVLYAFFDTSVAGAYPSVQRITSGGFGTGRVLRTIHRHATDAMLLMMLIHLARYFALDRLRGFRWFSWLTGVMLLWLAYVAAANGYMLPWDRLAQFVTQTSFEWLDWLPGFRGTLIRNFIANEHVSDRLFSLLVFIHIGVPLAMLLLAWVHVQRVPKASTQPPRPIALALLAMLLVLALVVPVSSHAPADLSHSPLELRMDWFVLPVLTLVHQWPMAAVWALVGGGTALLALLPWLPPRHSGSADQITLHPGPVRISARSGETLLDAGLRAGLALPYDCRAGGCGVCSCTILNGSVELGAFQDAALTPAMRARGQALMCCATALGDVELEIGGVSSLAEPAAADQPRRFSAHVRSLERLAPELMLLHLALPPGEHLAFKAGQYLNVILEDGARRAFSFANAPSAESSSVTRFDGERIELHVRLIPGGRFTTHVFHAMKPGDRLDIEGPLGRFAMNDSSRPILFVAGATGFAPVKSLLEDAFRRGVQRPMTLYWGARRQQDLYLQDLVRGWERDHPGFHYVPVLSEAADDPGWSGRRGLVHQAVLEDHPTLAGHEIYACGSVRMVQAAVPDFLNHGLDEQSCFSDAFTPNAASSAQPGPSA
ncbi:MAG: 2Fe-2S iron-sulfur cluster binding domain-containing protein [Rubrivivax sp.]|nr:2Fe-2S iron-sulfur cluster binding domain-containing protein [Rubrivivax sp.]